MSIESINAAKHQPDKISLIPTKCQNSIFEYSVTLSVGAGFVCGSLTNAK